MRVENGSIKNENLSYNDYKSKMAIKKKQSIIMFLSVFLVLLLVFLGIAKIMSPDVDISFGDTNNRGNLSESETQSSGIDSRLVSLKNEDDLEDTKTENLTEEDGLVQIPRNENQFHNSNIEEPVDTVKVNEPDILLKKTPQNENPHPISSDVAPTSLNNQANLHVEQPKVNLAPTTYRVYVGMYSTKSQAEVARGILSEAGLGLTPNIKQAAGGYTLQVGAFSSKESASNLANKLLINNYPARVVSD